VIRTYLANAISTALPIMVPSVDGKVLTKIGEGDLRRRREHQGAAVNGTNENEYALYIAINEAGRRAAATPPNFDPANTSFSLPAAATRRPSAGLTAGTGDQRE
jgi:para-nitrobenzyl esterase